MSSIKPPIYFWAISIVMLVWNILGIAAFISDISISSEALAEMSAEKRALYVGVPAWATAAYALAVFGGTLGCIALLMRRPVAVPLLVASLIGVLVQMSHALLISNTLEVMGTAVLVMPAIITLIAIFLIWFSYMAKNRAWLSHA